MAGRTATAVKSKTTSRSRATVKTKSTVAAKTRSTVAKKATAPSDSTSSVAIAPKPRRRPKAESRTRIYWAVFNEKLKRVAVFEFDQKAEAEKRAAKLMVASGEHHFIQKIKATVQSKSA